MTKQRRQLAGWVSIAVVGLLVLGNAGVLAIGRSDTGPSGHAVPLVDLGTLRAGMRPSSHRVSSRRTEHPTGAPRTVQRAPDRTDASIPDGAHLQFVRRGVDAPITRIRAVDGALQVPLDPRTLGWWGGGSAPGDSTGETVIVGHINYAGVMGALSALPNSRPGDLVSLIERGTDHRYRIVAIRSYPKTRGIPAAAFARTGAAGLVLITCGGPFDPGTGNYLDNIVAYARPV